MARSYNIFFTSDTHFGHENMTKFFNYDGSRVRPFETEDECDELMIENWNKVIKPSDKVYFLGDLAMHRNKADQIMPRLNGKKCLIRGNHDNFKLNWYSLYFYDVRGVHNFENFLMSHVPVHPDSKNRFLLGIHGHLHGNIVLNPDGTPDPWYYNVCMDYRNYTPVSYDEILAYYNDCLNKGILVKVPPRERE